MGQYTPASKVLLFFETCFFCATGSTESSGETRTTSCYCLCLFLCSTSTTLCYRSWCPTSYLCATVTLPFGYNSMCFPVLLLLTCPIPTQIKRLSILSINYHCVSNSSMRFPLLKVRPHGQKFIRTTWYNMVVRHKVCHGRGSVDGRGDCVVRYFRLCDHIVRPRS